ncbi:MAG: hypothetical protein IJD21_07590 [Oscillospiraceae bacterium]|nr:hypothetical protein [Oscillospiraceae bacterium]
MGRARYSFTQPREFPFFFARKVRVDIYDDRLVCQDRTLNYEDISCMSWHPEGAQGAIRLCGGEDRFGRPRVIMELRAREEDYGALREQYDRFWQENVEDSLGKVSWTQDLAQRLKDLRALKKQYDAGEIT